MDGELVPAEEQTDILPGIFCWSGAGFACFTMNRLRVMYEYNSKLHYVFSTLCEYAADPFLPYSQRPSGTDSQAKRSAGRDILLAH